MVDRPDSAQEVSARDFSQRSAANANLDIVQVPPEVFAPPSVHIEVSTEKVGDAERVTTRETIVEQAADGSTRTIATRAPVEGIRVKPGATWMIDSVVGQINGRPVYANRILEQMEDHIRRIVAENPQDIPAAKTAIARLVTENFFQYFHSELVIADAEGMQTPETQAGLLHWLEQLQETTVSERGGNRAAASQSLQDEGFQTMEEYIKEKREKALMGSQLEQRVRPRVIVSWRDVEREYSRGTSEVKPSESIVVKRIKLRVADELMVQDVESRFARGETFLEVKAALKLPDDPQGGGTMSWEIRDGFAGLERELGLDVAKALVKAGPSQVTAPFRTASVVNWYCITAVADPQVQAPPSIFDPLWQLQCLHGLRNGVFAREQQRYLNSLVTGEVKNDRDEMRVRLIQIAWARYLPES